MFTIGQVVFSKTGRDKGLPFIIVLVDDVKNIVYLCDGNVHKLNNPKKKNIKHVQSTNSIDYTIADKINNNLYIQDAMLRRALQPFKTI